MAKAEAGALADAWRRKRHAKAMQRIANLSAGLNQFNRVFSLLSGWALGLFAEQSDIIAAAEKSERAAKEAMSNLA